MEARILADEQRRERLQAQRETNQKRREEKKAEDRVRALAAHLREQQHREHERDQLRRQGQGHYVRAGPGQDCPDGWASVDSLAACKAAVLVLGGHDDLELSRSWGDRPQGCFWHTVNGHVNFNMGEGTNNRLDERICAKASKATRQEAKQLAADLHTSEDRLQKKIRRDMNVEKVQLQASILRTAQERQQEAA